jgi:hypothetical protein
MKADIDSIYINFWGKTTPKFTEYEIALMEGGHSLEDNHESNSSSSNGSNIRGGGVTAGSYSGNGRLSRSGSFTASSASSNSGSTPGGNACSGAIVALNGRTSGGKASEDGGRNGMADDFASDASTTRCVRACGYAVVHAGASTQVAVFDAEDASTAMLM